MTELIYHPEARHYRMGIDPAAATVDGDTIRMKGGSSSPWAWGLSTRNDSNWFGVSTFSPDWIAMTDRVFILQSLNGISTPWNDRYDALFNTMAVRYMRIEMDGEKVWETWSGEAPPEELRQRIHGAMCSTSSGVEGSPLNTP